MEARIEGEEVEGERQRRLRRFRHLGGVGGVARGVAPASVNESIEGMRVFFGGRGIWYDAARTRELRVPGITVGVLHTGRHYDDDLAPDGIVYHYPLTESPGKDTAEVEATKNAAREKLPIFVVVQRGSLRDVYLGWVSEWDDQDEAFLIAFGTEDGPQLPTPAGREAEEEWQAFVSSPRQRTEIERRERDPRFSFKVKKRYGNACAVCGLSVPRLVEAAHIIPVADSGSNHPGNGLPFCPTHHRAFDNDTFVINPYTFEVVTLGQPSLDDLRITSPTIEWLPELPHPEALEWRWQSRIALD